MTTNEAKKMKGKDPCWDGYKMLGTKPKGGRQVPNCIPEEVMDENIARLVSNSIKRITAVKPTPQQKADIRMNREETDKDPEEYDQEGDMAMTQLRSIIHHAQELHDQLKPNDNLPEWVQSKITLAQDYMQTAYDYMYSEKNEAANPAQQAAIAIAMKKAGKKPKSDGKVEEQGVAEGTRGNVSDKSVMWRDEQDNMRVYHKGDEGYEAAKKAKEALKKRLTKKGDGKLKEQGVAEGEVKQFPKKHRGDLEDTHSCVKCGGDLQGGTYMGHKVKVCVPCKQVYLPPNTGIDQRGNKVDEQGVAEESKGLWANIHAKRERIKHGSGEKMRKPGSKGAPTADAFRKSAVKEDTINEISAETQAAYSKASHKDRMTQAVKVIGSSGHDKEAAQKLKVRNAGLKRISDRIYAKTPKVTKPNTPLETDYGYGKGRYMGDSVELQGNKIDELSPATLSSYKKAAGQSASNLDKAADKEFASGNRTAGVALTNKANKRFSGIVRATKKQ